MGISGVSRLKGQARTLDLVMMQIDLKKILGYFAEIYGVKSSHELLAKSIRPVDVTGSFDPFPQLSPLSLSHSMATPYPQLTHSLAASNARYDYNGEVAVQTPL